MCFAGVMEGAPSMLIEAEGEALVGRLVVAVGSEAATEPAGAI
jgi:hypothetical protein